jgi:ribonucleoside-diphosphate reductase alpha chain
MSKFEELSAERKKLQAEGKLPEWFTTMGYRAFKDKYLYQAETFEQQIDRIVNHLGGFLQATKKEYFIGRWKELLMNNHAYLATPVLANCGTKRGLSVSCSGGVVDDSIYGFADSRLEQAILSQEGFGTSSYLGEIRHRGAPISRGGTADGVLPVFKDMVIGAENVSQGGVRRGAWAGYLDLSHPDFWEIALEVKNNPDGSNVGWNIYDSDIKKLNDHDEETLKRFQETQYLKAITGKGYYYFPDKVARLQPQMYKELELSSKASNLCTEITLHADKDTTYTCVLSGMVLTTYDEWKDTDAVFCMTLFLDCLVEDFLTSARKIKGLEKVIAGTEKGRAIGLGATGYHSALQQRMLPWDSFEAHLFNMEVFSHIRDETLRASQWMAEKFGEPEWCKGYGVRNTHRTALAPNVSSALIFGSESQGITPWYGNVYQEAGASGEMFRVNPFFAKILAKYDKANHETYKLVLNDGGSCRKLDFLSDLEKEVFKTFFEINQVEVLNAASRRQSKICQAQSINLAFPEDEDEEYISFVHQKAFEDPNCKSLYYMRSRAGVSASKGGCASCES